MEKPDAEITVYQTPMDQPSGIRTIEKLSSTFHPSRDTDSLSIITVRRNPQSAPTRCRHAAERNTKSKKKRSKKDDRCRRWKSEEWQLLRPQGFETRDLQPCVTVVVVTVFAGVWRALLKSWMTVVKGDVSFAARETVFKGNNSFLARYWGNATQLRWFTLNFIFRLRKPIYEPSGLWIALWKWDLAKQNSFMKKIVYCVSSYTKMMIQVLIRKTTPKHNLMYVLNVE